MLFRIIRGVYILRRYSRYFVNVRRVRQLELYIPDLRLNSMLVHFSSLYPTICFHTSFPYLFIQLTILCLYSYAQAMYTAYQTHTHTHTSSISSIFSALFFLLSLLHVSLFIEVQRNWFCIFCCCYVQHSHTANLS